MTAWVGIYAADVATGFLPTAVSEVAVRFTLFAVFSGSAVLCVCRARASRQEAAAWWLFALALSLWGCGSLYFVTVLWDAQQIPTPSPADAFWVAFYPAAYAALFQLLRTRVQRAPRHLWVDAGIAALGVAAGSAAFAWQSIVEQTAATDWALWTVLAYPVGDLGVLVLVVVAITVVGGATRIWRLIALAFAIFVVFDSIYLVQVAQGTYQAGNAVDLGWAVAALLIGAAARLSKDPTQLNAPSGPSVFVPASAGLLALGLLVSDHWRHLSGLALTLATATIAVIVMRMYQTVRVNAQLLTNSRREAMTDSLTRLGNSRQLRADLDQHLLALDPSRPVLLTLLDLDGFKSYNDTFGHPAGDQLLERLGGRLAAAVSNGGAAYRTGGDEFCVIWTLDSIEEALGRAALASDALAERGEAFSVGCSQGSVLMPTETIDVTEALRTADRRLYLNKNIGRVSSAQQVSDALLRALTERDSELGEHLDGVADLVVPTARRLGVPDNEIEAARQTALLHDVGKVAVPDAIINKPGALTRAEWQFIERHTLIGERIISAAPALTAVGKLVRHTHERWDGTGYPDGIAGDAIPLISRIVSVCDAFDAITSARSYRQPRSEAEALVEVGRSSGSQFDPAVVEAFASVIADRPAPRALTAARRMPAPRFA